MTKPAEIRLWPAAIAAILIVIGYVVQFANPADTGFFGSAGALVGGLTILAWWLFFSRVRWSVRLGAFALVIVAWLATRPLMDVSIIGGAMGALPVIGLP